MKLDQVEIITLHQLSHPHDLVLLFGLFTDGRRVVGWVTRLCLSGGCLHSDVGRRGRSVRRRQSRRQAVLTVVALAMVRSYCQRSRAEIICRTHFPDC